MIKSSPKSISKEVRTRMAPSPTGFLHIGTARSTLFNYLFAKGQGGKFILRIEDTDVERSEEEFEKDILENLKWLGIAWDEGPDVVGPYGPYRQSERTEIYKKYLGQLLAEGKAYYCFCSEEDIEAQRQYLMSIGQAPRYDGKCRNLSKDEVAKLLSERKKCVIRFKVPAKKIIFEDLIRGNIKFEGELFDDFVIARDILHPLYNFAVVVDDFEMEITHIIRGEDHLSNTPKQILIQEGLGFSTPKYAHLPLVLGPDKAKLSKRHGDVSIGEYRKDGYLPEAIVNLMAFLGWNPGTEREIYTMPSLIKDFSLERVQKGGAVFNIKRLDFLNGFYIRQKSVERLTELCIPYLVEAGLIEEEKNYVANSGKLKIFKEEKIKHKIKETGEMVETEYLQKVVGLYQERLRKLSEIVELADFFFKEKLDYNKEILQWQQMTDKEIENALAAVEKILSKIKTEDWNKENLEKEIMPEAEKMGDRGKILWPLRAALSGKKASAGPFEIAEILGRENTLKRTKGAKELIK